MVRTQVQLTEEQAAALRRVAGERGASMAELVRDAVDALLAAEDGMPPDERRRRAIAAAGKFSSGSGDGAERHDAHLARIYGG